MKTIGLIGLGAMGGSYAKHLIANDYNVFGVDPDKKNSDLFSSYGGSVFDDINSMVKRCEVIILSIPTVPIFKNVISEIVNILITHAGFMGSF